MELENLNHHQVHQAARYFAAAVATTMGHDVELVGPTTRLAIDGRIVQILSRRQPGSPWQTKASRPVIEDADAVIFVDLTGEAPDYYVAPASWVEADVRSHYDAWLASHGGVRPRNPESDHTALSQDRIQQWHQRWDVLTKRGT